MECQCMHCKFSRNEITKDFYLGYLIGQRDADTATFRELEDLGFKATGLSNDNKDIGHLMSVIDYIIDSTESEISTLENMK